MDAWYQSLEWSSDPRFRAEPSTTSRQSLDDLINDKIRQGWELQGIYPESADGSKYRLMFRVPCRERGLLAGAARHLGLRFNSQQEAASRALLAELLKLNGVCQLQVKNEEGGDSLLVGMGGGTVVGVGIPDGGSSIYVGSRRGGGKEVPLVFNAADGVLEPADARARDAGHTSLSVLVGEIVRLITGVVVL